jgi:hypothetical protein
MEAEGEEEVEVKSSLSFTVIVLSSCGGQGGETWA